MWSLALGLVVVSVTSWVDAASHLSSPAALAALEYWVRAGDAEVHNVGIAADPHRPGQNVLAMREHVKVRSARAAARKHVWASSGRVK